MVHALCRARPFRVAVAVFLVVFGLAMSAPTYADPGGNGKGAEKRSAVAQGGGAAEDQGAESASGGSSWKNDRPDATTGSGWERSSGDVTQPQPLSRADENTGGANGDCPGGPYCSTREGSPSGNGNGNGKWDDSGHGQWNDAGHGKPCAGCVGNADNKNPPGQMPGPSDHNNGYECDGNHGVGRTNPAHSGCEESAPPKEHKPKEHKPCKEKPPVEQPEEVTPPAEQPEVTPPAEQPEVTPPVEQPVEQPQAPRPPAQVPAAPVPAAPVPAAPVPAAPVAQAPAPAVLPPTGADVLDTVLGIGGAGLVLTGTLLLLRRRRTS